LKDLRVQVRTLVDYPALSADTIVTI